MFGPVEKRLVVAAAVLIWLSLLGVRVMLFIGNAHSETPGPRPMAHKNTRVNRAQTVKEPFAWASVYRPQPFLNTNNPFYINPAQPPPPAPPPVVRQVALLYQGSLSTEAGDRKAFLKVGDQILVGGLGTKVSAYFAIAEITARTISLRDPAGKATVLEFNVQKTVDIPIQ